MSTRVGRVGLQVWLVAAFVLVGAAASLAVLLVVLPTLESSVVAEAADREARAISAALERNSEIPGAGPSVSVEQVTELTRRVALQTGGVARFTSSGGLQVRVPAVPGATDLPTEGVLGLEGAEAARAPTDRPVRPRFEDVGDGRKVFTAVRVTQDGEPVGVMEVAVPVQAQAGELGIVRRRVFLAVAAVLLLASLAGYALSRLLGRRITRLATTARQLSSGDLSARAPEAAPREVATLAESLNRMAGRLEDLVADVTGERDRARSLIGSLAEGVLAVDPDGQVTMANAAARRSLGIPAEGLPLPLDALPPGVAGPARRLLDDPSLSQVEDEAVLPGGTEHEVLVGPLAEAGVVVTLRDVTDERRLERARRDLVANVSHELKTPLAALKGFLELLEDDHVSEARRREFLGLMSQEAARLERLVEEQLELARLDAGALRIDVEDVDLGELAAEVVAGRRPLAEPEGVTLSIHLPEAPVVVAADPARMEQILLILLDNALRHTPAGGRVDVVVRREDADATMAVRDTGEGIPADVQDQVFERFYQADPSREGRGLGLGLAIARGLARAHGGGIELRSAPGVGSEFTVRLPLARHAAAGTLRP